MDAFGEDICWDAGDIDDDEVEVVDGSMEISGALNIRRKITGINISERVVYFVRHPISHLLRMSKKTCVHHVDEVLIFSGASAESSNAVAFSLLFLRSDLPSARDCDIRIIAIVESRKT